MVANVVFLLRVYIHHFYPGVIGIKKNSNIKSKIIKTEGLVKKQNSYMKHIKHTVMPHGRHIYSKASYMEKATMCAYRKSDNVLPH